jgi:hypothetical protein
MRRALGIVLVAMTLAACGRSNERIPEPPPLRPSIEDTQPQQPAPTEPLPVDADLLAAPDTEFVAIEPSEVGVAGAPQIRDAIGPLISSESGEDSGTLQLTIREGETNAIVDIVRSDLPDDAVVAGQVRIEFRKEAEGWFPTNAYRRNKCRRGAYAMQWTTQLCP